MGFSECHHFDQATKEAIRKFATVHGNKSAVKIYPIHLGFAVYKATVRNFKQDVQKNINVDKQIKGDKSFDNVHLPAKNRE